MQEQKALVAEPIGLLNDDPQIEDIPASQTTIEQDVNPADWLDIDESHAIGRVTTKKGPLKIAAVTEQELSMLMKRARKMDPATKQTKTDPMLLRRWLICYSISKANGLVGLAELQPTNPKFLNKLTGELTSIQKAVQTLSGLDDDLQKPDPEDFLD